MAVNQTQPIRIEELKEHLRDLISKNGISNKPFNCLVASCVLQHMASRLKVKVTTRVGYIVGDGLATRHVWNDYKGMCIDTYAHSEGQVEYMSSLPPGVYKFEGFDTDFEDMLAQCTMKVLIKSPLRDVNGAKIYYITHVVDDTQHCIDNAVNTDSVWKLTVEQLKASGLM